MDHCVSRQSNYRRDVGVLMSFDDSVYRTRELEPLLEKIRRDWMALKGKPKCIEGIDVHDELEEYFNRCHLETTSGLALLLEHSPGQEEARSILQAIKQEVTICSDIFTYFMRECSQAK
jgi:hypothetical protein